MAAGQPGGDPVNGHADNPPQGRRPAGWMPAGGAKAIADAVADLHREALAEWRCPSCGATTRARMADQQDGGASAARAECADELRAHATAENTGWLPALADKWDGGGMTTGQLGIPQTQADSASLPPLTPLVTDDDVRSAAEDFRRGYAEPAGPGQIGGGMPAGLRAALEAYGARLLARIPSALPPAVMPGQE